MLENMIATSIFEKTFSTTNRVITRNVTPQSTRPALPLAEAKIKANHNQP
jgi:U3 small nucleolar ribonucleoprotein component